MMRHICGYFLLAAICSDVSGQSLPELLVARKAPTALVRSDGKVYVFKLGNSSDPDQEILEIFDVAAGSVRAADRPPLDPLGTPYYAAPISRHRLLLCKTQNCQFYDPAADRWENRKISGALAPMVTLTDGRILRAGGWLDSPFTTNESYLIDPETLATEATGSMNLGRRSDATVRLSDGKVLVAGGLYMAFRPPTPVARAEIYDPATGAWREISKLGDGLFGDVQGIAIPNAQALLKNTFLRAGYGWSNELKTQGLRLRPEFGFSACAGLVFAYGKDGFIIGLAGGQHVKDDSSKFMSGGSDRLGGPHLGAHAAVEVAEPGFALV